MARPPAMVALTLRLPRDLHEKIRALAELEDSSINREAVRAIRAHVAVVNHRGKR